MDFLIPALANTNGSAPRGALGFAVYTDTPRPLTIDITDNGNLVRSVKVQLAEPVEFGGHSVYSAPATVSGLSPNTVYGAALRDGGTALDTCSARTWPESLGDENAGFEILLGSCYSSFTRSPGGNDLGELVKHLSKSRLPHVKLLCGDQVYQDIPLKEILPPAGPKLEGVLLDKYLANWSPATATPASSFGSFLRRGSTLFVTDDHEYWNNYPYFLSYGPHLWAGEYRDKYTVAALKLVEMFQLVPPTLRTFTVGSGAARLSMAVLDGRRNRSKQTERAHSRADMAQLATFLKAASGPAIVVLSQPLFQESAGWLQRTFQDRGFADLTDYGALVDAIANCPHDVLVLSGDIHGGCVSSVTRAASGKRPAQQIVEVIASPLSLVSPGSYLNDAPDFAYPEPGKGQKAGPYERVRNLFPPVQHNHAAMLKLWSTGSSVRCCIKYLTTRKATSLGGPAEPIILR